MRLPDALRLGLEDLPGEHLSRRSRARVGAGTPTGLATIAFAGAGGKTSAIFLLARQLGRPVVVTSTTHLGAWQIPLADRHVILSAEWDLDPLALDSAPVTLVTGPIRRDRTTPLSESALQEVQRAALQAGRDVLIEADGSRRRPLKAPEAHEPAIPPDVDQVIYVAGLQGLGRPLSAEFVHRPELFALLSGLGANDPITPEALTAVMLHSAGGLKNMPDGARRVALLNQADTPELQAAGFRMAPALLAEFDAVLVAALGSADRALAGGPRAKDEPTSEDVGAVHERIAGIVLAAGVSKRFGMPKQLLDWHGQTFIRRVSELAVASGLSPVVVVTGANAIEVEQALRGLPVKIVRNQAWESGQASSIRAGVASLLPAPIAGEMPKCPVGGAVFLLADQPQVEVNVVQALVERHATTLHSIVAPLVEMNRRANPVLFDVRTFPALMDLEGDAGGRALFGTYRVDYLDWHDERLLLDVDTPADYERLLAGDGAASKAE